MTLLNECPLKDKFCLFCKKPHREKTICQRENTVKAADCRHKEPTSAWELQVGQDLIPSALPLHFIWNIQGSLPVVKWEPLNQSIDTNNNIHGIYWLSPRINQTKTQHNPTSSQNPDSFIYQTLEFVFLVLFTVLNNNKKN